MFPMMVGIWLGEVCGNSAFGMLCGSIAVALVKYGLAKFAMDADVQALIIAILWLLFMIYRFNWKKVAYYKNRKLRKAEALAYRRDVLKMV